MREKGKIGRAEKTRLIVLPSLLAAFLGLLLSGNTLIRPAHAFRPDPLPDTPARRGKSRRPAPNAMCPPMPARDTSL